jgi:hypothetical protein
MKGKTASRTGSPPGHHIPICAYINHLRGFIFGYERADVPFAL